MKEQREATYWLDETRLLLPGIPADPSERQRYLAELAHSTREGNYLVPLSDEERQEARERSLGLLDEIEDQEEALRAHVKAQKAKIKDLRDQLKELRGEARTGQRAAFGAVYSVVNYDQRRLLEVDASGRIIYERAARGTELQLQVTTPVINLNPQTATR